MGLFAAVDTGGNIKFVGDVARGAACDCFCPACKSPVVAKQGSVLTWHFAHEAGQERPECLPGSINLLRRLAVQTMGMSALIPLPPSRTSVMPDPGFPGHQETVTWENSGATIHNWFQDAPSTQPAAQFVHEGYIVNLYVEIGSAVAAIVSNHVDGCLVFACPEPPEGAISTEADALSFLRRHGSLRWVFSPDFKGIVEEARNRLLAEVEASKQRKRQVAADIERRTQLRRDEILRLQAEAADRPWPIAGSPVCADVLPTAGGEQDCGLPIWASWKRPKTSFYAFRTDHDCYWIVMQAADHDGCYIVPAPVAFDGWDESLPSSIGTAAQDREAFISPGIPINQITNWFYGRKGVQSRIDSDPEQIAKFISGVGGL